jgi:hypothetical protein
MFLPVCEVLDEIDYFRNVFDIEKTTKFRQDKTRFSHISDIYDFFWFTCVYDSIR